MKSDDFYDWKEEVAKLYDKFIKIFINDKCSPDVAIASLAVLLMDILEKSEDCDEKDNLIQGIIEKLKLLKREYEK